MSNVKMAVWKRTKREHEAFDMGYEMGKRDAVRHGRVVTTCDKWHIYHQHCSECGNELDWKAYPKYCEECGAKLDQKE